MRVGPSEPVYRNRFQTTFGGCSQKLWVLAYEAMVLKRNLMILYESATTGVSTAQIIATQNASSGMWAFGEGMEVMYMVVLLYLLWPIVFNIVGRVASMMASPKAH
jgi:hypothetical protein